MSESSLLAEGVEDVDLGDNALEDLIQEAQSLMNDLPLDPEISKIDAKPNVDASVVADEINQISLDSTSDVNDSKNAPKQTSSSNEVTSADTRAAINIGGELFDR